MKTFLKLLFGLVALLIVVVATTAAVVHFRGIPKYEVEIIELKVEPTPERLAEGAKLATMLCKNCHFDPATGKLTGARMPDAPPEFGTIYSRNITQHPEYGIGEWTDGDIAYLLRTGLRPDGQFLPMYMPKLPNLSDEDLYSIIAFLRSDHKWVQPDAHEPPPTDASFLTKALTTFVMGPFEYPTQAIIAPDKSDKIAYGKYLVTAKYDCYACHSADFKTVDMLNPEKSGGFLGGGNLMLNKEGEVIYTANITFDETGIGHYTKEQLGQLVRFGKKPDGTMVRYPMIPFTQFTDEEIDAIYEYLKTVPPIKNDVKKLYAKS